jgi:hypothetical protein
VPTAPERREAMECTIAWLDRYVRSEGRANVSADKLIVL